MQYPWDDGTRERQERLLILIGVCVAVTCILYLIGAR
jgi:hypothetical protein